MGNQALGPLCRIFGFNCEIDKGAMGRHASMPPGPIMIAVWVDGAIDVTKDRLDQLEKKQ